MKIALIGALLLWPVLVLAQPAGCVQSSSSCTCYSSKGRKVDTAPGLCGQLFQQPVLVSGGVLRMHETPLPQSDQVEPLRMSEPPMTMSELRRIVREAPKLPQ